jgi:V/A-type H+-transporting ATPase subunit I
MMRVELLGPRDLFTAALEFLQEHAVVQLRVPTDPGVTIFGRAAEPGAAEQEARLEDALRRIDALTARLPPARASRPDPLPAPGTQAFSERLASLQKEADALERRRAALVQEREAAERLAQLVVALAPIAHGLDPAVEPELYGMILRGDGPTLALLDGELRRITGGAFEMKSRPLDADRTGVLLAVPRASERAVTALLSDRGVDEMKLPPEYGGKRLVDLLLLLSARERALPGEIARADAALAAFAGATAASLAAARHDAMAALERRRAVARCGGTRFAFVVSGYMPEEKVPALRSTAATKFGDKVSIFAHPPDRAEWGDVPVVLRDRAWIRPFQQLLALVPLPRYGSIDPTPWVAMFFPLFFGLVLGDVAFGIVGIAAALVVRKAGWGGAVGRDVAAVALWCSASAALFGLLFGEAFGELGAHVGLHPFLLDRRHAFLPLLGIALAVGGVHMAVGMILGVVSAGHAGRFREATGRAARLLLLASAALAAAALLEAVPRATLVTALVASGAALAVAVLAEGPLSALHLVLLLSNVLSYARLMALGLASVMLAEAANRIATTLEPAAFGLALAVLLHLVNFTLGLVSPALAALRLHYVEFFEKFYDEGGFPFRPFGVPG